ncbi:MAG TPA: sugar-transfer associated ATP-grasp domain-containing protein [Tissierellaceae bacterium]|nr:sugar-transfer associated ATP-grasp domain-containing protein [Tissierellaceae bacterium]
MKKKIRKKYQNIKIFYNRILKNSDSYDISLFKRIKMNLRGFIGDQYVRYDFENNDIDDYISEVERWKSRRVNGRYNIVMDDTLIFSQMFKNHVNIPEIFAWIKDSKIYDLAGIYLSDKDLFNLICEEKQLVFKPAFGTGGGRGVYVVRKIEDKIFLNDKLIEEKDLLKTIKELDDYIITEFISQHEYSNNIYDKTTNTIRLITIIEPEEGTASIVGAVHRIGIEKSIPVDNASKGALVAKIDLDTGTIGEAKTYFDKTIYRIHPDSKAQIEGVKIPFWSNLKKEVLEVAQKFPYIPFMAWDILITEDSYSVIEINASTGLDLLQIWGGERHSKLGEFYKFHNIIK